MVLDLQLTTSVTATPVLRGAIVVLRGRVPHGNEKLAGAGPLNEVQRPPMVAAVARDHAVTSAAGDTANPAGPRRMLRVVRRDE